jgi:hypothetical protein
MFLKQPQVIELSNNMLCIIDLCGEDDTIIVTEEKKVEERIIPQYVPMPMLQILPVENEKQ